MSQNTQNSFETIKYKQITAKQSSQLTQNSHESNNADEDNSHNAGSSVNCTSHLLQSTNFPRRRQKFARQQRGDTNKQKSTPQKRRAVSVRRATVPITPQMIRVAVKALHTRRVYISSALIASHLRRCYPIESNPDALKRELNEKLNCAVSVGLIAQCGDDKYCIPTLRQQASLNKTALTAFWDTYYKHEAPGTMDRLCTSGIPIARAHKKRASVSPKRSYDSRSNNSEDLDECDNSVDSL